MKNVNSWNVIFLVDECTPQKVVLLKRASDKTFAPDFYTGIGGKIGDIPGQETETPLDSAYRELMEETCGEINPFKIVLREFARCVYDDGRRLYYFYGQYGVTNLPYINPQEGSLMWVSVSDLLGHNLIPTTKAVCEEWAKRDYVTNRPFTLYVQETGKERTVSLVKAQKIEDGLT